MHTIGLLAGLAHPEEHEKHTIAITEILDEKANTRNLCPQGCLARRLSRRTPRKWELDRDSRAKVPRRAPLRLKQRRADDPADCKIFAARVDDRRRLSLTPPE